MALGSTMLQLSVIQDLDEFVSEVEPFFAEVFEFLTLGTVTVREIAMEKIGGILGPSGQIPIEYSNNGFATLRLLFASSKEEVFFLAPSHVSSPQVTGAGLAILEVKDVGVTSTSGTNLQVARHLGAHACLDEI